MNARAADRVVQKRAQRREDPVKQSVLLGVQVAEFRAKRKNADAVPSDSVDFGVPEKKAPQ